MSRSKEVDWESLDWTKNNAALAREVGMSRERVRQVRIELGKPVSTGRAMGKALLKERVLACYSPELTLAEIAEKSGVSRDTARCALKEVGKKAKRSVRKYDWLAVDWAKINVEIARELGVTEPYVSEYRKMYAPDGLKRSPYFSRGAGPARFVDPERRQALIERQRASCRAYYQANRQKILANKKRAYRKAQAE
jgi:hypothetical protein